MGDPCGEQAEADHEKGGAQSPLGSSERESELQIEIEKKKKKRIQ